MGARIEGHLLELRHWIAMPINEDLIPRLSANFYHDTIVRDRSPVETNNVADFAPVAFVPANDEFHARLL